MSVQVARVASALLGLAAMAALAGCAVPQPVAHIPVSGVNGGSGGSEQTLYYDAQGRPHFEN